jgi:hypothetical protein
MMGYTKSETGSSSSRLKSVPPGAHLARCYRIIDLGTQGASRSAGTTHRPEIAVQFEVWTKDANGNLLVADDGGPLVISKSYALSLSENASLRKDLTSWRGKDFSPVELRGFVLKNILGQGAMISVALAEGSDGEESTDIIGISGVPDEFSKAGLPPGHHKLALFTIAEADLEAFETFSKQIRDKIEASPEWASLVRKRFKARPNR